MSAISIRSLQALKDRQEKFTMLTAYDATLAQQAADAGVEVLLVGDSLGNVIQGQDSTLPVSVEDMAYHTRSEEHTSELQSRPHVVCRLLLEKKNQRGLRPTRRLNVRGGRNSFALRPALGST